MVKQLPNFFTLINLSLGFFSILLASMGGLTQGAILILVASVFDFLDGFLAKKLNASSELGKQLDSLADMVTFGVSPAILVYFLLASLPQIISPYSNYIVVLIPIFSALRLAKFNIDENQTNNFIGLPTPANALFFVSIVLFLENSESLLSKEVTYKALLFLILVFSYLLTSKVSFFSLKFTDFNWKTNQLRYVFLGLSLILLFWSFFLNIQVLTLSIIILLYIVLSLLNNIKIKNEI